MFRRRPEGFVGHAGGQLGGRVDAQPGPPAEVVQQLGGAGAELVGGDVVAVSDGDGLNRAAGVEVGGHVTWASAVVADRRERDG